MSWQQVALSDVATAKKGKKPKTLFDQPSEGRLPYIDIKAFEKGVIRQYAEAADSSVVNPDQILVVWDGARSGLVGRDCAGALGSTLAALQVHGADLDYVFRFLQSKYDEINSRHKGTGIPHVDPEVFWNLELPLPPTIEEQRRIVAKLDQVIAHIDGAKARLDTIPTTLKRFRQSILAAACSGRLTADWRNVNSTGADRGDIPNGWRECRFNDVLQELRNGISRKPEISHGGMPILRISAVRPCKIDLNDHRFIPAPTERELVSTIQDGDLLFTRYNGNIEFVGVCGVVRGLGSKDMLYPDKLMRVRLKADVTPEWIEIFFSSPDVRDAVTALSKSSAGQNGISGADIKSQPVLVPPIAEQTEITRRVEALFKQADTIEARYKKACTFVEKLTPSVLAKTFRGELV